MQCDVLSDWEQEKGKSIKEKVIQPNKHTAKRYNIPKTKR